MGAVGVGGEHGVYEHGRVDLEGHVVDGLAFDAGGLGYFLEVFAGHVFEVYVFEGDEETDLQAEVDDFCEDLGGALLQHDHGYNPEGHLLPVPVVVRAFERGEPVVDEVGGTEPARLEAKPGEQGVRLDMARAARVGPRRP